MHKIKFRSVIVPDSMCAFDNLNDYGHQYAHQYLESHDIPRWDWLNQNTPDWYIAVETHENVPDTPGVIRGAMIPNAPPVKVNRADMFVAFDSVEDAVLYKLTW